MEQVIYVDILIFLNTVITFILLLTTSQLMGITPKVSRLITGSLVGGAYSLIILAPPLSTPAVIITRAAMCITLICIAFDPKKSKVFFRLLSVFILSNFLYAGIIYAVFYLISPEFLTVNNGFAYYDLNFVSVITATAVAYIIVAMLRKTVFKKTTSDNILEIEIKFREKSCKAKALFDTGNNLTDPFNGKPVIITNRSLAKALTGVEINADGEISSLNIHLIPVSSVSGQTLLPCFPVDKITVYRNGGKKEIQTPVLAVTDDELGGERYSALLNKELL